MQYISSRILAGIVLVLATSMSMAQTPSNRSDYFSQGADLQKAGRHREAIPYFTKAIEANRANERAFVCRGWAWVEIGECDKGIADLDQALSLNPSDDLAFNNRGWAFIKNGDYNKAMADLNQALRINSNLAIAYTNRSNVWFKKGDWEKALNDSSKALQLTPDRDSAYVHRSFIWLVLGEYEKAWEDCDRALAINPKNASAHYYRGNIRHRKGEYEEALAEYHRTIELDPRFADAYNDLASIQACCPNEKYRDGPKAFGNARQAYLLSGGKSYIYTCTLAEAYAENKDFPKAREWMEKAIAMAANASAVREQDTREMRLSLELFKQGKPFRDIPKSADNDLSRGDATEGR
jgi:tetratricopeptide (TPR) repeat protein